MDIIDQNLKKDGHKIFVLNDYIETIDGNSFHIIYYDSTHNYYFTKDKKYIYILYPYLHLLPQERIYILTNDIKSFTPIKGFYSKDKTKVYFRHYVLENVVPDNFTAKSDEIGYDKKYNQYYYKGIKISEQDIDQLLEENLKNKDTLRQFVTKKIEKLIA